MQPIDKVGGKRKASLIRRDGARHLELFLLQGAGTSLYTKDFGGDENFRRHGRHQHQQGADLTPHEGTQASILDALLDGRRIILVSHNKRDKRLFDVYRINIKTGAETLVAQNLATLLRGTPITPVRSCAGATDGVNKTLLYRETETAVFKPLLTTNFRRRSISSAGPQTAS